MVSSKKRESLLPGHLSVQECKRQVLFFVVIDRCIIAGDHGAVVAVGRDHLTHKLSREDNAVAQTFLFKIFKCMDCSIWDKNIICVLVMGRDEQEKCDKIGNYAIRPE